MTTIHTQNSQIDNNGQISCYVNNGDQKISHYFEIDDFHMVLMFSISTVVVSIKTTILRKTFS